MQGGWQPPGPGPTGPTHYAGAPGGPAAAPGMPASHAPGMPFGHYEFNPYENAILAKTAGRARLWGAISALLGFVQMGASCGMVARADLAAALPLGLIGVIVGFTFVGVGNSLRSAVDTRGNDLSHLMQALQKLGAAFMIQAVCTVLAFVMAVLVLVVAVVYAASSVAR